MYAVKTKISCVRLPGDILDTQLPDIYSLYSKIQFFKEDNFFTQFLVSTNKIRDITMKEIFKNVFAVIRCSKVFHITTPSDESAVKVETSALNRKTVFISLALTRSAL